MLLVDFIIIAGNIVVLYILISQKSLHTPTNSLILSLTVSDLLLGILIIPFAIVQEDRHEWLFGELGCRFWLSLDVWLSTSSIYNLLAISFDRYMAVKQPIRYPSISSTRVIRTLIFLAWSIPLLLASVLFILETLADLPKTECSPVELPSIYILFSASVSFIIPAVIMIILNVSIFNQVSLSNSSKKVNYTDGIALRVHRGRRKSHAAAIESQKVKQLSASPNFSSDRMSDDKENIDTIVKPTKESHVEIRSLFSATLFLPLIGGAVRKTERSGPATIKLPMRTYSRLSRISLRTAEMRVARTTSIVVGAFIISWFPFFSIYVMQINGFCKVPDCVSHLLFTVAFWLGYSNSAINPLLYALFSRDFRNTFRKVITKLCQK
ncbi:unnamed protein product [Auanema sp. JU1783]|nr:unnamed protein product [Auanema sp. JU1783]